MKKTKCYSDHDEDIRTKGSCDYCHGTEKEEVKQMPKVKATKKRIVIEPNTQIYSAEDIRRDYPLENDENRFIKLGEDDY